MIAVVKTNDFIAVKDFLELVQSLSATSPPNSTVNELSPGCRSCEIFINIHSRILLIDCTDDDIPPQNIFLHVTDLSGIRQFAQQRNISCSVNRNTDAMIGKFFFSGLELTLVEIGRTDNSQPSSQVESIFSEVVSNLLLHSIGFRKESVSAIQTDLSPTVQTDPNPSTWEPPRGTTLSTIRLKLLHDGELRSIDVNTSSPVPFRTDLFEGRVLLLVNSKEEQKKPYVDLFSRNSYRFELQIQGKFRDVPSGPIFFGGEITKKMELGMITRGICSGLLQLGRSANAHMHHSFGDKDNYELPHIVGPFWSTVDRLVVTAQGETPPPFMVSFPEEQKHRTSRKSNPSFNLPVDLTSTYSFSMKTGMMNLEEWGIVAPMFSKSMSLNTFWADADLRFSCYCVPTEAPGVVVHSNGQPKTHPQQFLQHFFCMEVQHFSNHSDWPHWSDDTDVNNCGDVENLNTANVARVSPKERARTASSIREHELYNLYENVDLNDLKERSLEDSRMPAAQQDLLSESEEEFFDAVEGDADESVDGVDSSSERESIAVASVSGVGNSAVNDFVRKDGICGAEERAEDGAESETDRVSALLREKLSMLHSHITTHSERYLLEPGSSKLMREKQQMENSVASTFLKRSLISAIVEVEDCRRLKKGKRRIMYAFLANPHDSVGGGGGSKAGRKFVLHSYGEWKSLFPVVKLPQQPPNYSRYSEDMKRKVVLAYSYEAVLGGFAQPEMKSKLEQFLSNEGNHDSFLTPSVYGVGSKKLRVSLPPFCMESPVCVQVGNNTWSEECMGMCADELIFIKPSMRLGTAVRLRIPLHDIIAVRKISDVDNPLPLSGCFPFLISTFAKQYTVLLRGSENRDTWFGKLQAQVSRLQQVLPSQSESDSGTRSSNNLGIKNSALRRSSSIDTTINSSAASLSFSPSQLEGMVCYPPDWNLNDRMILNARNFTCSGVFHQLNVRTLDLGHLIQQPCLLVEKLLEMAFILADFANAEDGDCARSVEAVDCHKDGKVQPRSTVAVDKCRDGVNPEQLWIDFMDGVALLQCIDLSIVDNTSPEAACLFMNLYHCMLLHSYMVVGLPNSLYKWSNFFRHCSYEAFGDIFSLSELEHCIMRAGMSRPNINFLAQQLLIPNGEYSFALKVRDYRLLWGIFCGATSNVSEIPIYTPDYLDQQLNCVTRSSLAYELKVKDKTITLPVLCQLYAREFDPAHQASAPTRDVLQELLQYLSGDQREAVQTLLDRKGSFSVKYTSLNFQCKYPTRCDYI